MTHGHLCFHFTYCFENYTYNDEKSGTTERNNVKKTAGYNVEDKRETSDKTKEERTHQNDLVENLFDVNSGRSAGTNAGDRTALLHKVIGNLNRIERNRNVEISKCDDQNKEQNRIDNAVCGKKFIEEVILLHACELHDCDRERNDRARKDDRHNTGHIELDREIGTLTAVLFSANSAFCVLNRNSSFSVGHISYEYEGADNYENNGNPKNDLEPNGNNFATEDERIIRAFELEILVELAEHGRQTGYDICKKDHGNTVTDTLFVNFFTEPHNEASTCSVACDDYKHCKPFCEAFGVNDEAAGNTGHSFRTENRIVTVSGNNRDTDGYVTSDFFNLLSAFFAVLGKSFKSRNCNSKKLNDNGSVDVRLYGQREQGCRRECITGENVQVRENTFVEQTEVCILVNCGIIDKRNRQSRANAI